MFEQDFAYPKLSAVDLFYFRLLGPGLGNLLFPWARAVCYAKDHNLRLIWPTWPQIKIGPILRREPDLRLYGDLFVRPDNYISGIKKIALLGALSSVSETMANDPKALRSSWPRIIRFSGMADLFSNLMGRNHFLREELLRMTRSQHKVVQTIDFSKSISVHVRLGDFLSADTLSLRAGTCNTQIPIEWYIDTVNCLRSELGEQWPVHIFSDGTDEQLSDLLCMPNVSRLTFNTSIADMVALSQANVLISSASTFSMWASFLGMMPVIWFPGQLRKRPHRENADAVIERDYSEGFSKVFLEAIINRT